jgi:hypothetical protein
MGNSVFTIEMGPIEPDEVIEVFDDDDEVSDENVCHLQQMSVT